MRTLTYLDAIVEAQRDEMARDENVFLMGLDVSWNITGTTGNKNGKLSEQFGLERVRDAPISENGYVGTGAGAAMVGMRPIVEIEIAPFIYVAMDQLVSIISKSTYIYGGQASLPITIRMPMIYNVGNAAQHSDRPISTLATIPGLKIIAPSTPRDMYGLLRQAIQTDDPVVVLEDFTRTGVRGEVPDADEEFTIPLGRADIKREGSDVTIVTVAGALGAAEAAANQLADEGIDAEILDPRSILPLDLEAILTSVAKTGKLVVADPCHDFSSIASQISAEVVQEGFWDLEAPIQRVTTPHTHIPYVQSMEKPLYPNADRIVAAVHQTME
ncbi:alpha-ketoacid dehydrogenase subunit beta [Auritidibacter sp. NML120636]|uniref:alpha-ketoacid dehydrogenase subunit beta n=1 Tax=Auritidibacter sp. NML120636 TaxID=2170743 RepID=UPI000D73F389|nr:transketolase C-terminal domain-containing protein [Auritidibacter sp. NML120636]PXA81337.1 alpha-ketoacid dehydrogenase subunit beta [Auritidibacter sp. NML120636]